MHLQSLELFGFKSFADKAIFNFHEGVTAIVGPNGCGKSNLLDAVRWVLGEQSAKSLRGGEMADVIFNGTDSRKPLGFAEVSLTFTDCAAELNVDWNEVRVTRRVYRDGNSEYLLNKTPCRLRDVQNLFADTGMARAAYSMMEQGKIDLLLSSRPEDRRAVFEEAAGITKYKAQKRDALRKLEATEANLLRIGDVIKEVKRQIGSLQRQAGKARRYQALHADLRVLDTHYSRKQLDALEQELAACRAEIKRLAESEQKTRAQIDSGEKEIAQERGALDKVDIQIADARTEVQRLQNRIAADRNRIEFNQERAQELGELIERVQNEIGSAEAKRSQQTTQIQETDSLIQRSEHVLEAREVELKKLSEELTQLRVQRTARERSAEELRIALTKSEGKISALEDELTGLTARREATAAQIDALASEISEAREATEEIAVEIANARAATANEQQQLQSLFAQTHSAEENLHQRQKLLTEGEKSVIEFERTLAEKKSRLEVLRQLNEKGRGLAEGSQAVLTKMGDQFREAIVSPLVSRLDVDSKFIAAIEAALGRNLHAIILNNGDAAAEIIARLTREKLGQAALLLPQADASLPQFVRTMLPKTALAWAIDKVAVPRPLEELVRQLLQGVAIFSKLEQALECKKDEPTLAMATLAGEFVSAEGIVFGGSGTAKSDSLLERKAEIANLEKEETSLLERRDALARNRDEAKTAVEAVSKNLNESRERYQAAHLAHSTSAGTISLLEREHNDAVRNIDNLQSERETLEQQIGAAAEYIAHLQRELHDVGVELTKQQAEQKAAETAGKETIARESETAEKLNELRLAIATEHQRHENLLTQRQTMAARVAELAEVITARHTDISSYENKLGAQASESSESSAAIEEQTQRCRQAEASAAAIAKTRVARVSVISEHETALRHLRDSLSELQDQRGHQQVSESQLQMQIENLAGNISRRYQLDLRAFSADQPAFEKTLRVQLKRWIDRSAGDVNHGGEAASNLASRSEIAIHRDFRDEDLQHLIVDLTRQLDNMGPVNLDAVHEYDELEERYKFLETQNNDLTNSRRELLDVIARINSTTRKMFAETFAQIRVNFREMFAELFGGGRADLSLMDENDPLNCGIDIVAKPPGKQLQNISLLSGGERAMTAVALLFAIYMVRPSPFCVLDEIDAPLDESNINRFIRVLDRFVAQSQFIIITHNKRTIAKADVLYGVTMEERGVSKLVGMKLTAPPAGEQSALASATISSQRQFALAENGDGEPKSTFAAR
jgi:chromosome segregation protein